MNRDQPLRLLFSTQSIGLRVFWSLHKALQEEGGIEAAGFFVTNRPEYARFNDANPDFAASAADVITEWELLDQAHRLPAPDLEYIAAWEKEIADPTLWNALIIDRRLNFHLRAQFVQSYKPAYSHEDLLRLLQVSLQAIDAHFDRVRPHAVMGLNAVTLYDYLYYLVARRRGIPVMQLKLTRVRNYVSLYTDPFDLSPHIRETFERMRRGRDLTGDETAALADAQALLSEIREKRLVYEGAIKRPNEVRKAARRPGLPARLAALAERLVRDRRNRDRHYPAPLRYAYETKVLKPLRRRLATRLFDIPDAGAFAEQNAGRYALYPLNTEPEVALLAFGRPYRNQIESVRNIAASLPVGWKLVVKEHPNSYGYRSAAYYGKLRAIPNVVLAGPTLDTDKLMLGAGLVAVVFGTIGLEALIKGKPVVVLCNTPYGVFPRSMVRFLDRSWGMAAEIRDLLENHKHDDREVVAFLAAHMTSSIRLNLFTDLLGKGGRQTMDDGLSREDQYAELARYTRRRIAEERARLGVEA
ncbi:hypothetical protein [Pelagibius sp. 7325]|uniref:capsular polysaccharide export protein, LipB/KpsS family n=1 Tax=Pelagibius sp. 7325 TaxID=3131994 RepID=UPI0030ECC702